MEKFSYSKLEMFQSCGWRYKLHYIDKHFIDSEASIATDFGTLIHFVEETIANDIVANNHEPIFMLDDQKYIDLFINGDIEVSGKKVLGIKKLKEKYPDDFYVADKSGMNYEEKANDYLNYGIFRLRDYLAENKNIHIVATEQPFNVTYGKYIFHGFIDRILRDAATGQYILEDIKTWPSINDHNVTTPLQFVVYTLAAQELYHTSDSMISCYYDLPLAHERYAAGSRGYMVRGIKKIETLFSKIESEEFIPKPSPLCHWCAFSKTYPNQPEEAKNLCPYYSKWTKDNKTMDVEFEWMGIENHEAILAEFTRRNSTPNFTSTQASPMLSLPPIYTDRITVVRRN